ncbi:hypothetical protein MLD38_006097 [Melastoma candidum]|uniref:Uncharacterized protein n=1 Tax=Melastoma candidum TaxID=119954 RepID=A0ACB9RV91_9MYRT|nr:hypothetical protein MLD38_006097 [Melastoma candidum]
MPCSCERWLFEIRLGKELLLFLFAFNSQGSGRHWLPLLCLEELKTIAFAVAVAVSSRDRRPPGLSWRRRDFHVFGMDSPWLDGDGDTVGEEQKLLVLRPEGVL